MALGYDVVVESGAGAAASFADDASTRRPARASSAATRSGPATWSSRSTPPSDEEIARLRDGAILVSLMAPAINPDLVERLPARRVTGARHGRRSADLPGAVAGRAVARWPTSPATAPSSRPPTSSAACSPARSPRPARSRRPRCSSSAPASRAGRHRRRRQPRRHGARLRRPARGRRAGRVDGRRVPSQSTSDGAAQVSADGYAKEMARGLRTARPPSCMPSRPRDVDIIITTALIPGRPAPRLITAEMVAAMKPGSVIVDMAAANGGNCERPCRARRSSPTTA